VTAVPGDIVMVEPGTPHHFRNAGYEELRFVTEVRPALGFETFLKTMFGLAADGKTNKKGLPNPLRLAVIMRDHFDLVRLPFPPAFLQKAGLILGAPLGRLLGYCPTYVRAIEPVQRRRVGRSPPLPPAARCGRQRGGDRQNGGRVHRLIHAAISSDGELGNRHPAHALLPSSAAAANGWWNACIASFPVAG
jgi:hypothetical protein